MSAERLKALSAEVSRRMNTDNQWTLFLKHAGLTLTASPKKGEWEVWEKGGMKYQLKPREGAWRDTRAGELTPADVSIYEFVIVALSLCGDDSEKRMGALQALCDFLGLREEFNWSCGVAPIPDATVPDPIDVTDISVVDNPLMVGKRVRMPLRVICVASKTYDSPVAFTVKRGRRMKEGGKAVCGLCPPDRTFTVPCVDPMHFPMSTHYEEPRRRHAMLLMSLKCGLSCKPAPVRLHPGGTYKQLWVGQQTGRNTQTTTTNQFVEKSACLYLAPGTVMPVEGSAYMATGWVWTNPYDSSRQLFIESLVPINDDWEWMTLSQARPCLSKVHAFGVDALVREIAEKRCANVGSIDMTFLMLLTYCSVRWLQFNGELIRGWLVTAISGDSTTGKSRTYSKIADLLGQGDLFQAETGTRAGLLYATQRRGDEPEFYTRPGAYPRANRRILCIEELQCAKESDVAQMGAAMRDGKIKVGTVAAREFDAEVRLLLVSNCGKGKTLSDYTYGVTCLKDLFAQRLLARIDVALISKNIAHGDAFDEYRLDAAPCHITPEDLKALVFSAWLAKPADVVFSVDVTRVILATSKALRLRYGSDKFPLVCHADMRNTLARMAAAYAILSGAMWRDGKVYVETTHVQAIEAFLIRIYSAEHCALDKYVRALRNTHTDDRDEEVESLGDIILDYEHNHAGARMMNLLAQQPRMSLEELTCRLRVTQRWVKNRIRVLSCDGLVTLDGGVVKMSSRMTLLLAKLSAEDKEVNEAMADAERIP